MGMTITEKILAKASGQETVVPGQLVDANIDALWTAFCGTLAEDVQADARRLAHQIGLVPVPGIAWSDVFQHQVTLSAPALFRA